MKNGHSIHIVGPFRDPAIAVFLGRWLSRVYWSEVHSNPESRKDILERILQNNGLVRN